MHMQSTNIHTTYTVNAYKYTHMQAHTYTNILVRTKTNLSSLIFEGMYKHTHIPCYECSNDFFSS